MKRTLVIYTTKPEHTEENARLIGSVFDELQAHAPEGLRYLVLRYGEGRSVHVVEQPDGAPSLSDFEAFRAFQKSASERWLVRPEVSEVTVVGSYGMMPDAA
ncbi:MAG TPA: hypothetical protein VGD08_06880 [Stellaceae bacterium]|jgi:hypothetical protein